MRWTQEQLDAWTAQRGGAKPIASPAASPKARTQKYGNRKVRDADGNVHDSTKEFRRWQELQLRERAGQITGLRRQVPFALVVDGVLVCSYVADAVYHEGQALIVEDTKSPITRAKPEYRIKLKLMQAIHKLQVREV